MEAPQWLTSALARYLRQASATAPDPVLATEAQRVVALWCGPAMTTRVLARVFECLDELDAASADPVLLRLGAAYRGQAPAAICQLDPSISARIEELGNAALSTEAPPADDIDACLLADAYLAVYAGSPQAFAKLRKALREESHHLDEATFARRRLAHLRSVLVRPRLFLTPFAQHWEEALRENLEGELARIDAATLSEAPSTTAATPRLSREALVIRKSAARKHAALAANPVKTTPAVATADSAERSFDDTSSMEDFTDLFAHKRGKPGSPHKS